MRAAREIGEEPLEAALTRARVAARRLVDVDVGGGALTDAPAAAPGAMVPLVPPFLNDGSTFGRLEGGAVAEVPPKKDMELAAELAVEGMAGTERFNPEFEAGAAAGTFRDVDAVLEGPPAVAGLEGMVGFFSVESPAALEVAGCVVDMSPFALLSPEILLAMCKDAPGTGSKLPASALRRGVARVRPTARILFVQWSFHLSNADVMPDTLDRSYVPSVWEVSQVYGAALRHTFCFRLLCDQSDCFTNAQIGENVDGNIGTGE